MVGESWAEKPSSPAADGQVVENGVSGECRAAGLCLAAPDFVLRSRFRNHPPVELSRSTRVAVSEYVAARVTSW